MDALVQADILCALTVPRLFAASFTTPAALKDYLRAQRIWPERVTHERWRLDHDGGSGYVVELVLSVPAPQTGGAP